MPGPPGTEPPARGLNAVALAARLARYWRTSAAVLLATSAVGIGLAYGLPAVYEATAVVEVTRAGPSGRSASAVEDMAALVRDRPRVEKLLRDTPGRNPERALPANPLDDAVSVKPG